MILIYVLLALVLVLVVYVAFRPQEKNDNSISQAIELNVSKGISSLKDELNKNNVSQVEKIGEIKKSINDELHRFKQDIAKISDDQIGQTKENLRNNFQKLQEQVEKRLEEINAKVETRLSKGFEDTNKTFTSIIERLAKIDEAQKQIETLSKDVVSLSDILSDKKSRGTFGEVQLHQILSAVFGEKNDPVFELQKEIKDGNNVRVGIVDAVVKLPPPTGMLPIDSKFPLENYRRMYDSVLAESEREDAKKKFKADLRVRIDETSKYVIEGVTSQYAIMFLTAEAIFAEINAYHPAVIEYAHKKNVYIASPTTLFALMNTVQAVLRDLERSKQAQVIRENLNELGAEFKRYKDRWENLSKHIGQVTKDVDEIYTTTRKISDKFEKIQNADLPVSETQKLLQQE